MKITTILLALSACASSGALLYQNAVENDARWTVTDVGTGAQADFDYQTASNGLTPTAGTSIAASWAGMVSLVAEQSFTIASAVPEIRFSIDVGNFNNDVFRENTFQIVNSANLVVATLSGTAPASGEWEEYSADLTGFTAGTYRVRVTTPTTGTGNAGFDNFQVNSIPEPTSTALFGLGGLVLLAQRKRA